MPKLDIYHNIVKRALEKDNWTITHDPFKLKIGEKWLYADLGADRVIRRRWAIKRHCPPYIYIKLTKR